MQWDFEQIRNLPCQALQKIINDGLTLCRKTWQQNHVNVHNNSCALLSDTY